MLLYVSKIFGNGFEPISSPWEGDDLAISRTEHIKGFSFDLPSFKLEKTFNVEPSALPNQTSDEFFS